jgi:membrane associated rhomboid family serine protease
MCLLAAFLVYFLIVLFLTALFWPLPINDAGVVRYRSIGWATLSIIVINTVIFVLWIAPDLYANQSGAMNIAVRYGYHAKMNIYGYSELALCRGTGIGALAAFSSMFMHADFWHLFGNMVYLWTFGRRVEDACGAWRFLLFYLTAGMVAFVGFALLNPALNVAPGVGASGAIAGVMGAYLLLFPGAKIVTLWGIGTIVRFPIVLVRLLLRHKIRFWRWTISLPAWLLLIAFAVENTIPSVEVIMSGQDTGGVAYLAHLAGFLAALLVFLFVRKDLLIRYLSGRSL